MYTAYKKVHNQLSHPKRHNNSKKNIKHIEYIRLNILLNILQKYGYHMSDKYKYSTLREINRKFNIVRRGVNK